jgi:DNA-binding response OmpR family regulator
MSSPLAHTGQVRVLVVEDHVALGDRIGAGLRDAGLAVDVVYDGAAALEATASTGYDVVVLDRTCRPSTATASAANWSAAPRLPAS